jgi:transposase
MVRVGELVQPLIQALNEHLQRQDILHLDETTFQVLDEPGKPAQSKSYLWLMASFNEQPAMVFHYASTRRRRDVVPGPFQP